jgi:diaminohydroxyphosphoribosylaminopyrimidine deaminase/5-amino-6-(5-phosphoribosylamino)uracil reductase
MIGVGTVIADDPQLTCRIEGGRDPIRVIVDTSLRIPLNSVLLTLGSTAPTIIATTSDDKERIRQIEATGAEVLICSVTDGRVNLSDILRKLGARGIQSVLLEGGAMLAGSFLQQSLIDRCLFFYAPKLVGGDGIGLFEGQGAAMMKNAIPLEKVSVQMCGADILVEGEPNYKCLPD